MRKYRPLSSGVRLPQPQTLLPLFLAIYLAATFYLADLKPLWYDELFTFYIAGQGSPSQIWTALGAGLDYNPPLIYVTADISQSLFGFGNVATRLPSILGFLLLMLSVYRFASFRMPLQFALQAMVFVALTGAYWYAYEARPYGLLLGFAALALSCWQRRQAGALAASLALALLTHCYSVLLLPALFADEFVKYWYARKVDLPIWLALVLPCGIVLGYIPLMRNAQQLLWASPVFAPSLSGVVGSYVDILLPALLPALAVLAMIGATSFRRPKPPVTFERHEWAALAARGRSAEFLGQPFRGCPFVCQAASRAGSPEFTILAG